MMLTQSVIFTYRSLHYALLYNSVNGEYNILPVPPLTTAELTAAPKRVDGLEPTTFSLEG